MGIDWWWGSLSKDLVFLLFKLQVKQYGFVEVTAEPAETGISQKNTLKSNTKVDRVTHSGILMGICQKSMWISSTKSSAGFVVPFDISMFILRIYNHYHFAGLLDCLGLFIFPLPSRNLTAGSQTSWFWIIKSSEKGGVFNREVRSPLWVMSTGLALPRFVDYCRSPLLVDETTFLMTKLQPMSCWQT